jgi:ATP-dependent helicase/nuclease subunit B
VLAPFGRSDGAALDVWLDTLVAALQASGAWAPLLADDAGRQLATALHLGPGRPPFDAEPMSLSALQRWVDAALESASFLPPTTAGEPLVVVTPLALAILRPFASVVFPGADEKHLGAAGAPHPLLGDRLCAALGLPDASTRQRSEALAFAQVLRLPRVTLLRRIDDAGEPLAASPLLERLALARRLAGRGALPVAADPLAAVEVMPRPVPRPLPSAPELLPARLSASACESLRTCPYQFFALRLLRLRSAEELDDAVEKRDYGNWLHRVLNQFHRERAAPRDRSADSAALQRVADEVRREMALDGADFLPFAASFARVVPPYLTWLHGRDAAGATWLDGELSLSARPSEWGGIEMHGVIDRVDGVRGDDAAGSPVTELIDYKTGSAKALRDLVKQPQEDTQLAFYAALVALQSDAAGDLSACYLPLDDGTTVKAVVHPDVEASAWQLIDGLGHDLARLRAGAPMPALGEGSACDFCDARGLCRRDHWVAAGRGT